MYYLIKHLIIYAHTNTGEGVRIQEFGKRTPSERRRRKAGAGGPTQENNHFKSECQVSVFLAAGEVARLWTSKVL